MRSGGGISIWFFVGVSLLVNGALILGAGLWEFVHPPANPVVLFRYHANVWWGAALISTRDHVQPALPASPHIVAAECEFPGKGTFMSKMKMTMGLIVGNRGFFPAHLANSGREEMTAVLQKAGMDVVVLTPEDTKCGAVTTREEVKRCVDLFTRNRDRIDGVIVTLPNFGEERAIADTLRLANLRVPVLVQATPDDPGKMTIAFRRDSFCGKMSACNNLKQYGIPYSITSLHTEAPDSPEFAKDLEWFAAVCRVVKGLKNLRVGSIGARPTAFNTVRYSEKIAGVAGHLGRDRSIYRRCWDESDA